MKHLAYFTLITTLAVACDVKQDLGDTASGTEGSSGGGSEGTSGTTGGSEDTGVLDTGPWSGTTGESTGSEDTGVLDTGPWSGTTGDTTGGDEVCEPAEAFISWDGSGLDGESLGFITNFVGVGSCTPNLLPPEGSTASIELACTLSGTRDGEDDFVDEAITLTLSFETSGGAELPALWPVVGARFLVGSSGFALANDRFFVLQQPMFPNDADGPILFASQGQGIVPVASEFTTWHEGAWYGGPSIAVGEATCSTQQAPDCGRDVAIEAGWLDEAPIVVHGTQAGTFGAPTEGGTYDIYVASAWNADGDGQCPPDFPSSDYAFVAVGATPQ